MISATITTTDATANAATRLWLAINPRIVQGGAT
jgi:hypothetical protein